MIGRQGLEAGGRSMLFYWSAYQHLANGITQAVAVAGHRGLARGSVTDGPVLVVHACWADPRHRAARFVKNFMLDQQDVRQLWRCYVGCGSSASIPMPRRERVLST